VICGGERLAGGGELNALRRGIGDWAGGFHG
jgi:hypothetical protein